MVLLNCLSAADFVYNMMFRRLKKYDSYLKTVVDFCLSLAIILLSQLIVFMEHDPNFLLKEHRTLLKTNLLKVWGLCSIVKLFRLFLFFFKIDKKNTLEYIIRPIGFYLKEAIMQVLFIYIIFTSLFTNIYGGKVNTWSMDLYNQGSPFYLYINPSLPISP